MFNLRAFAILFLAAFAVLAASLHAGDDNEKLPAVKNSEKLTEDNPPAPKPKAIAKITPNPANVAVRGAAAAGNNIIILDGTESKPANNKLTFSWTQTGGNELKIQPAALARDRVGLRIYKTGKYKFQLTVSDGKQTSEPVEVEVEVVDPDSK